MLKSVKAQKNRNTNSVLLSLLYLYCFKKIKCKIGKKTEAKY